ncbi:MAG: IPT/TIG domain-containing protein, partial [Myxococcota bacterium]
MERILSNKIKLFGALSFFLACTTLACLNAPSKDESCQKNEDCTKTQQCIGQVCRSLTQNAPPLPLGTFSPRSPRVGERIILDASRSRDKNNQTLQYKWILKKPENSQSEIDKPAQAIANFIADMPGTFTVTLTVDDGETQSARNYNIEVAPGALDPPIADAGPDLKTGPNLPIQLKDRGSRDAEGESKGLRYTWSIINAPKGSAPKIEKPNAKETMFVANQAGTYTLSLVVHDSLGLSSKPDTLVVGVIANFDQEPILEHVSPNTASSSSKVEVQIKGKQFQDGARVELADRRYETTFVSAQELKAKLDLNSVVPRKYELKVINVNNKPSSGLPFEVTPVPTPEIAEVSPGRLPEGRNITVTLKGKGFFETSQVIFETTPMSTKWIDPQTLQAELTIENFTIGQYKITIANPGGIRSKSFDIFIAELGAPPSLKLLNPSFAIADTQVSFSVHGSGFEKGAKL